MKGLKMLFKILILIIFFLMVTILIANISFQRKVAREVDDLLKGQSGEKSRLTNEEIKDLPSSVQRWLHFSGCLDKEKAERVFLKQSGHLRLEPGQEKWQKATANQYFLINEPSFLWSVKTNMKGLPVVGRDLYKDGKGHMLIKLLGLVAVVDEKNHHKLDESTLQRYLGEMVWFPIAAISPYIKWQAIDEYAAKAIMDYGGTQGEVIFYFNDDGSVNRVEALRYMDVEDLEPTLWQAKVEENTEMDGLIIPTKLEVTWVLDEGPFTWYKFEITELKYNE